MATTTKEKAPLTDEQRLRARAGLTIGRGIWQAGYKAENPEATKEQRSAAWKEVRKEFKKIGMKSLKALEKNGLQVVEKPS